MPDCLTKEERDRKLVQIAHSYTDLTEADIHNPPTGDSSLR